MGADVADRLEHRASRLAAMRACHREPSPARSPRRAASPSDDNQNKRLLYPYHVPGRFSRRFPRRQEAVVARDIACVPAFPERRRRYGKDIIFRLRASSAASMTSFCRGSLNAADITTPRAR